MNYPAFPYRIFPLGDAALLVDFGNRIDEAINQEVIEMYNALLLHPLPGMTEAVPAYSSLAVFYDTGTLKKIVPAGTTVFEWMKEKIEGRLSLPIEKKDSVTRLVRIPVCYENEMAPDLLALAASNNLDIEEVISIHTGKQYKVYMLGFLPGFAYMGQLDERIAMPRKPQPQNITEGSIGIAGRQTGIYPLASPGGWQIIGRTPWRIFDVNNKEPTLLKAGDRVEFYSITKEGFDKIKTAEAKNS